MELISSALNIGSFTPALLTTSSGKEPDSRRGDVIMVTVNWNARSKVVFILGSSGFCASYQFMPSSMPTFPIDENMFKLFN